MIKKFLLSAGVMIGAYMIVDNIRDSDDSDNKERHVHLRELNKGTNNYKIELTNDNDDKMYITVNAANRHHALDKVRKFIDGGSGCTNIEKV